MPLDLVTRPQVLDGEILPPGEGGISVLGAAHPFRTEQTALEVPPGLTVQEILDLALMQAGVKPGLAGHVHVMLERDGQQWEVDRRYFRQVRPKPGTNLLFRVAPKGGGGGGKNPLRTMLMLAVTVAALVAAPYIAGPAVMGFATGSAGFAIASGIVGAGITLVGTMLVNAIAPPRLPELSTSSNAAESPTYRLAGARNVANHFGPVPSILGRHRVHPNYGAMPYTEMVGQDQYLRMLFVFGYGPLAIEDIRIGETPITDFTDWEMELRGVEWVGDGPPPGTILEDGDPFTLYPGQVIETEVGVVLSEQNVWVTRTSQENVDELSVDLDFPQGLVHFNQEGKRRDRSVDIEVEYRPVGGGAWTQVLQHTYRERSAQPLRFGHRWKVARGQYEVRVRRTSAPSTSDRNFDTVQWAVLRSIRDEDPVKFEKPLAALAIRIKASEQLTGVIDSLNAICTTIALDYHNGSWSARPTTNPASLYRHVLQGPANARPRTNDQIDLPALEAWHQFCEVEGFKFNHVRDFDASVWSTLADIASAGRAAPAILDGRWGVVMDGAGKPIVQHITPRNSWGFSAERVYRHLPHGWRVRFISEENGWNHDERIVYDDGYDESNATLFEGLELPGVTDPDLVWRHGRYHIASARLRPEVFSWNMDFEHIVFRRGDLVRVTHDVTMWGLGSARVKEVLSDGGLTTGIVLDDELPAEAGKDYAVRVRRQDGASWVRSVVNPGGTSYALTFKTPVAEAQGPQVGDLVLFGEEGQESVELLIRSIEPSGDLTARVTGIDYAPEIYLADQGAIPPYDPQITRPPDLTEQAPEVPRIIGVVTGSAALQNGREEGRIIVRVAPFSGTIPVRWIETRHRLRGSEDSWTITRADAEGQTVVIRDVEVSDDEETVHYDIAARSVSPWGVRSAWSDEVGTESAGDDIPPGPVTNLRTDGGWNQIALQWDNPPDPDLDHVEIWEAAEDDRAVASRIAQVSGTSYVRTGLQGRTVQRWYWARAVDAAGNIGPWNAVNGTHGVTELLAEDDLADSMRELMEDLELQSIAPVYELPGPGSPLREDGKLVLFVPSKRVYRWNADTQEWEPLVADIEEGQIRAIHIAANTIGQTHFADNLKPIGVSNGLPDPATWDGPDTIVNEQDGGLYYLKDGEWITAVPEVDLDAIIVENKHIVDGAVDALKLAANAVTSAKIATGAVLADKLADAAVTAQKIAHEALNATHFAQGLNPVQVVDSLPDPATWDGSNTVVNRQDDGLYYLKDGEWVANAPDVDLDAIIVENKHIVDGAVDTLKLAANAVTAAKIATGAVLEDKLADAAVTGRAIAANAIITEHLQDELITAEKLVANAVTEAKLAANAVTQQKLANAAVRARHIAQGVIDATKFASGISAPEIKSTLPTTGNFEGRLVFLETDGKLYRYYDGGWTAAVPTTDLSGLIEGSQLVDEAITAAKLAAEAVEAANIKDGAVVAEKLAEAAVTAGKIANGVIGAAKFASDIAAPQIVSSLPTSGNYEGRLVVYQGELHRYHNGSWTTAVKAVDVAGQLTNEQIAEIEAAKLTGQITEVQIKDDAISAPKLAAGSVISDKVAANAIVAAKIASNAVQTRQIQANAVVAGKIASNAIEARHIVANSITAGAIAAGAVGADQIAANAITSDKIAANAITAKKLVIGDFTNLVEEPSFLHDGAGWNLGGRSVISVGGHPTGRALSVTPGSNFVINNNDSFPALPGDKFLLVAEVAKIGTAVGNIQIRARFATISGVHAGNTAITLDNSVGSGWQRYTAEVVAPSEAATGRVDIHCANFTGGEFRVAYVALHRMTSGELIVDGAITAEKITANAITSDKLAANAVVSEHILANAIDTPHIRAGAVDTPQINANAITSDKILANAITSDKIHANAVRAIHLDADSVTAGAIEAGAVGATQLAANAVTADKIAAGSITADRLMVGYGKNLLHNASFTWGLDGWEMTTGGGMPGGEMSLSTRMSNGSNWGGHITPVAVLQQSTDRDTGYADFVPIRPDGLGGSYARSWPCTEGEWFEASLYASTHRCQVELRIRFIDASGTYISSPVVATHGPQAGDSSDPEKWPRLWGKAQAPAGAVGVTIHIRKRATESGTNSFLFIHKPMLAQTHAEATGPADWSDGGVIQITSGGIVANAVMAEHIVANAIQSEHIATGAVIADSINANAVTSEKILAGAVQAEHIAANAITASKLAIGDFSNLVINPEFADGSTDGWSDWPSLWSVVERDENAGDSAVRNAPRRFIARAPLSDSNQTATAISRLAISPGESLHVSFEAAAGGGTREVNFRISCWYYRADGTEISSTGTNLDAITGTSWSVQDLTFAAISDPEVAYVRIAIRRLAGGAGRGYFTNFKVHRLTPSVLIEDGAITAEKITANAITGSHISANAIAAVHINAGAINAPSMLANNVVVTEHINANAITAQKINSNAIVARHIQSNAVKAGHIEANAIETGHITAGAVKAEQIDAGAITAEKIAADAISAKKLVISDFTNLLEEPSFDKGGIGWNIGTNSIVPTPNQVSSYALSMSAGGSNVTNNNDAIPVTPGDKLLLVVEAFPLDSPQGRVRIRGRSMNKNGEPVKSDIIDLDETTPNGRHRYRTVITAHEEAETIQVDLLNQLTAGQFRISYVGLFRMTTGELIVDGAVTAEKITANAITGSHISANAIAAVHIAANAVNASSMLADNVVVTRHINANAVTAQKINSNAIETRHIRANQIEGGHIKANSIETGHITSGAVKAEQINANAITSDKIAANAITAKQIAIGDFENICKNPQFRDGTADGWDTFPSQWSIISRDPNAPHNAIRTAPTAHFVSIPADGATRTAWVVRDLPIKPGERFYFSVDRAASGSGSVLAGLRLRRIWRDAEGNEVSSANTNFNATSTSWQTFEAEFATSNTDAATVDIAIQSLSGGTNTGYFTNLRIYKMTPSTLIENGAITTEKVAANAITANKLAADSVTAGAIAAGAVNTAALAANAVVANKIASNAIQTRHLTAGSIRSQEIAANTIRANNIYGSAVNDAYSVSISAVQILRTTDNDTRTSVHNIASYTTTSEGQGRIYFWLSHRFQPGEALASAAKAGTAMTSGQIWLRAKYGSSSVLLAREAPGGLESYGSGVYGVYGYLAPGTNTTVTFELEMRTTGPNGQHRHDLLDCRLMILECKR